jgi:undecaprenyl-diphosphatase
MAISNSPVEQVAAGRLDRSARPWLAGLSLACLVLFCLDAYLISVYPLLPFDLPVERAVQQISFPPLVFAMKVTNQIAGYLQILVGVLVILGLAVLDRRAGWLMAVGSISSLLDNILKVSFERGRPTADLVQILTPAAGYSFPSGHAVFYTWLAFMAAFAVAPRLSPPARTAVWLAAGALVVIGCLGRVWAGDHWPSDVLGGFLLGLGWSAFVLWLPERRLPNPRLPRRWSRRKRRLA